MSQENPYVMQYDEKSFCKKCGKNVELLVQENPVPHRPMFYICFHCMDVAEVGVGEVKRV